MKKRDISILAKILSVLYVTGFSVWVYIQKGTLTSEDTWAIIQVGLFIALMFSPVDISVWIDKFLGKGEPNDKGS